METIRAELSHLFLIIISPVFFFWNENRIYGIICTILYIAGNVPFLMIQRYNRPRIEKIEKIEKFTLKARAESKGIYTYYKDLARAAKGFLTDEDISSIEEDLKNGV